MALLAAGVPTVRAADQAGELAIETRGGAVHRFTVELALTPEQRQRGLMFRERMAPDHGMLFDFETPQPIVMWMRNTPLPLDMLFIDADGRIAGVAADTTPFSEAMIPSPRPVRFVLEVNAGTARQLGIAAGDRAVHRVLAPR